MYSLQYIIKIFSLFILLLFTAPLTATAQGNQQPEEPKNAGLTKTINKANFVWLGTYTKYQLSDKLFYTGEYHLRTQNGFDDMAQVYIRLGLSYLFNKNFELTAGIVTPFYWAPDQDADNIDKVVPQYRGWQQFLFIQSFPSLKLYHQIRTEQRFKRDFEKGSEFKLTHRFRYRITTYVPLNKKELTRNTLFLAANAEVFVQAGKPIVTNYLEDTRVFGGLGYILSKNIQLQAGYMWSFQPQATPGEYLSRDIYRFSIYHNLDFRKQ